MNLFKRKFKSHAYYDKEWAKLSREDKDWGLSEALRWKERRKFIKQKVKAQWEAREKAEKEGKRCYCLPRSSPYYEECDHCRWDRHDDWINTPG